MWIGLDKETQEYKLIKEVNSGLSCNCKCVDCGSDLVAKKGEFVQHHFAHASGVDRSQCAETALHIFAKTVLSRQQYLDLPDIDHIDFNLEKAIVNTDGSVDISSLITEMTNLPVVKSALEYRIKDFQPDVLTKLKTPFGDSIIALEVAVTHFVDEEKRNKIKAHDLSMIEIDYSDLIDKYEDSEEAEKEIVSRLSSQGKWIQVGKSLLNSIRDEQELENSKKDSFKDRVKHWLKVQVTKGFIDLPYYNFDTPFADYRSIRHRKFKQDNLKLAPKVWSSHPIIRLVDNNDGWLMTLSNRKKEFDIQIAFGEAAQKLALDKKSFLTIKEGMGGLTWSWGYNAKAERFVSYMREELDKLNEKSNSDLKNLLNKIQYFDRVGWPSIKEKEVFNAGAFSLAKDLLNTTKLDVGSLLVTFDQPKEIFGFDNKMWQFFVLECLRQHKGQIVSVNDIVGQLDAYGIQPLPVYKNIFWQRKNTPEKLPEWTTKLDDHHKLVRKFCIHLTNHSVDGEAVLVKKAQNRFAVAKRAFTEPEK